MDLRKIILIAFVFSGAAALIYEVVWTRPLQIILGSTIYTVSIIFAAFMLGLALGSLIISKYVDKIKNLPATYALFELGIGLYGILLINIFNLLPDVYRALYPLRQNFYLFEFIQFLLAFAVLIIPTTLMGATFPVIVKFYTQEKIGKGIGEVYSANNIGAIIGSFAAGFLLIPLLGIKTSIIIAATLNIIVGISILLITSKNLAKKIIPLTLLLFVISSYFVNYNIEEIHTGGFYGAEVSKEVKQATKIIYYKEGLHATISVGEPLQGGVTLYINGKGQGSSGITDLRVNFLLAYLPLLLKEDINDALVVGLGTGTTSGQLSQFVDTTTVEIEPAIIDATKYFSFMNFNVSDNPNHNLIITDGRNYLLKSNKKYDIITEEPCDPWQAFSTSLYSKEYFELVKYDLTEDGMFIKWVPIYTMSPHDFRIIYKTFNNVFPYVVAFANIKENENLPVPIRIPTSEIIFIGSKQKLEVDKEKIKNNFNLIPIEIREEYLKVIGINSAEQILNLFLFTDQEMKNYGADVPLVTDDNPILEFSTAKKNLYQNPKEVTSDIEKFLIQNKEKRGKENYK